MTAACLLLLFQSIVLLKTRWVEDESWNTDCAATYLREGRLRMSSFPADTASQVDTRPPLMPLTLAAAYKFFGIGVFQSRVFAVIAGILTVVVVFFLGVELGGPHLGGLSALLVAADSFLVAAARTTRPEIFTTLSCTLGLLLFYQSRRKQSVGLSVLAGVAVGIAMNYHPLGIGMAAAIGLLYAMESGWGAFRQLRAWAFAGACVLSVVPFVLWIRSTPVHYRAFKEVYLGRAAIPYLWKLQTEVGRYADFLGISNQRFGLPFRVPVRLHIVLIVAGAFVWLYRTKRRLALELAACLAVNMLWWTFLVNKGPRSFAFFAPILALVVATSLLYAVRTRGWRRPAIAIGLLFVVSQVAGNAWWVYHFRKADYPEVSRQLRAIIPDGASAYGIITFYMALNDHPYYSYDRTPFAYAMARLHPEYLILYDRVMMNGSGFGLDDFADLRSQLREFTSGGGATLAGEVDNEFYGNLKVYKVTYPR